MTDRIKAKFLRWQQIFSCIRNVMWTIFQSLNQHRFRSTALNKIQNNVCTFCPIVWVHFEKLFEQKLHPKQQINLVQSGHWPTQAFCSKFSSFFQKNIVTHFHVDPEQFRTCVCALHQIWCGLPQFIVPAKMPQCFFQNQTIRWLPSKYLDEDDCIPMPDCKI